MLAETAETGKQAEVSATVARHLRATARLAALAVVLAATTADAMRLYCCGRLWNREQGAAWLHRWCGRILRCMGVESRVSAAVPGATAAGGERFEAIVCNHLSYLDILLMASAVPCVLVAKSEVRRWPLIGWLTTRSGAVFVWRGGRRETYATVNAEMAWAFRSGVPVAFFPEGTTTDGRQVLPFRRGLFHSVLHDDVAFRTAAIEYELLGDEAGAAMERDVCWCGDAALIPHLYRLLGLRGVQATVRFGRTVVGADRFALSQNAREAVLELAGVVEIVHC